jgi:hypothetical protein
MRWLRRHFQKHNPRDINCVMWDAQSRDPHAVCIPCEKDGGFTERRRDGRIT